MSKSKRSIKNIITGKFTPIYYYIDINCLEENSNEELLMMEMMSLLESQNLKTNYTRNLPTTFTAQYKSKLIKRIIKKCGIKVNHMILGHIYLYKARPKNWSLYI